jgi:hypothetical protein
MGNRAVFAGPFAPYAASHCLNRADTAMRRYLVERSFPPGSQSIATAPGEAARQAFIDAHDGRGVSWLCTYLTPDHRRSYCIVDGPSPEAVRDAARASGLPADRISEVRLLERGADRALVTDSSFVPKELS